MVRREVEYRREGEASLRLALARLPAEDREVEAAALPHHACKRMFS